MVASHPRALLALLGAHRPCAVGCAGPSAGRKALAERPPTRARRPSWRGSTILLADLAERLQPGARSRPRSADAADETAARSKRARPREPGEPRRSTGSGFVIDPSGLIVTNAHVIEGAAGSRCGWPTGERFPGKVIGRDNRVDLALLKIDGACGPDRAAARRLEPPPGGRVRARARQSVRARAERVVRDRQPQGRPADGGGARVRLHPDRRGDQPRQLRRAARQRGGRGRRRQQHGGAQRLDRLRDPLESRQDARCRSWPRRAGSNGAGSASPSPR